MITQFNAWFASVLKQKPFLAVPRWRYLSTFLAGSAMVFAYAPFAYAWLAPILLAYWLLALVRSQTAKQAVTTGFSFGLGWFATGISWVFVSIDQFGGMPLVASLLVMLLLCAYLALFPALASWLWFRCRKYARYSLFFIPLFWLMSEFLRGWLFTGFPWLSLGYSQTSSALAGFAPHIGEIGISIMVLLIAISFSQLVLRKQLEWLVVPLAIYSMGWFAPALNPMQPTGDTVSVALVQGNIAQGLKWEASQQQPNLDTYLALTEGYYDYDIIVWPESAITYIEPFAQRQLASLDARLKAEGASLISGIIDLDRNRDEFFNSMIVLGTQPGNGWYYGHENRYQKHQLLPIGEFVPFEALLRPLAPLFNLPMSSFSRGAAVQPNLQANGVMIAANICYEVAFSRQIRANMQTDTQLLLTISNDTWFGDSHGPHQHLEIAKMRALELGRPMLRATNNGITAVIDERGNTLARLPQFNAEVATTHVVLVAGSTYFARFGEIFAWLLAVAFAAAGLRWKKPIST